MVTGLLGLYWEARREPLDQCAKRTYESLILLRSLGYDRYFLLGRSRKDALRRQLDLTPESVHALLARGVNRTDLERKPIPELGWRLNLWSGDADDECYSFAVHCGSYARGIGNNLLLQLPIQGPHSLKVSPERACEAFHALVPLWRPQQAVLCEGSITWNRDRLVPERQPLAMVTTGPRSGRWRDLAAWIKQVWNGEG